MPPAIQRSLFTVLTARLLLVVAGLFSCTAAAVEMEGAVAVYAKAFNGYTRVQLPDNTFKPEYYVMDEGGAFTRPIRDPAMDRVTFPDVARIIASPLARQNYLPAPDADEATLLILVFWGSTQGSNGQDSSRAKERMASAIAELDREHLASDQTSSPEASQAAADAKWALSQLALANAERDRLDEQNAQILGYTESLNRARFVPYMTMGRDTFDEISENRYFVVLKTYDFRVAKKDRKLKLLWQARISVSGHGDFTKALENMAWSAVRYLGKDSDGLRHILPPEGTVEIGEPKVVESDSD